MLVPGCGSAHDSGRHDAVALGPYHQHGANDRREIDSGGLRKLWHRKEQLPEIAPGFADQTAIYLLGDVLGLRVSDPASKLPERRGAPRVGLSQACA